MEPHVINIFSRVLSSAFFGVHLKLLEYSLLRCVFYWHNLSVLCLCYINLAVTGLEIQSSGDPLGVGVFGVVYKVTLVRPSTVNCFHGFGIAHYSIKLAGLLKSSLCLYLCQARDTRTDTLLAAKIFTPEACGDRDAQVYQCKVEYRYGGVIFISGASRIQIMFHLLRTPACGWSELRKRTAA